MNILYDISILGRGHVSVATRTGIFRVIENLVEELIQLPECKITLCTNSNWADVGLAMNYMDSHPKLSGLPFSAPINYSKRNKLQTQKKALAQEIDRMEELSLIRKSIVRLKNKQLTLRGRSLKRSDNHMLHPADLQKADIFHSHFFANFSGVKEAGVNNLFITNYDMIPVLFPHYCSEGTEELMISILNQLTRDTWIVCISEATRNDLLNYMGNRIDPDKVSVTELAASHLFYQSTDKHLNQLVRHKYGIPDAPYVLSLCTLEPRKNIDQAIRAFVQLVQQENVPDLNLVLVGAKGWKSQKIFDAIDASDAIKQRIYITGYMADEDLAAMYSDALMFVYPSFYEGFGLPPLEAMQCGVPVITSNTSSLPEVVGDAGMMVSPTDLDALCGAMLSVYQSPALRQQMIQQSLDRAKLFSWKKCAEKTADAYKTSLQS